MPTLKKTAKSASPKAVIRTGGTAKAGSVKIPVAMKPVKTAFNKSTLAAHVAEHSGVDPKSVKAVLATLETTMLASVVKKGLGAFTLPGVLKVNVIQVPAKKKRFGKDPFSGEERWFAAKPASVKIKTRALKKLKDAAQ